MKETNNKVTISGEVVTEPEFNHEVFGEKFYIFKLASERTSGVDDIIPIIISERLYPISNIEIGKYFEIDGKYRSFNKHNEGKSQLVLNVFCCTIFENEIRNRDKNIIEITGYLCKPPIYRKTPLGREIADLLVAVNRPYAKSDYIPCIAWGRNAGYSAELNVGTEISLEGRIQSRTYQKKIDEETFEEKTAYEVSIRTFKVEDLINEEGEDINEQEN